MITLMEPKTRALMIACVLGVGALVAGIVSCSEESPVLRPSQAPAEPSVSDARAAPPRTRRARVERRAANVDAPSPSLEDPPALPSSAAPADPSAPTDAEVHTLIVRVVGPTGAPAPHVDVQVFGGSSAELRWDVRLIIASDVWEGAPRQVIATERTDASGLARISIPLSRGPAVQIRAHGKDLTATVVRVPMIAGETTSLTLTLAPSFELSGFVRRTSGAAVADAQVFLGGVRRGQAPNHLGVVTTDERGTFRFPPIALPPEGTLAVYAIGSDTAGTTVEVPARQGVIDDVIITVDPSASVRGRCVDEEGKPLPSVRIRGIFPFSGEITYTGADGRFSIKIPGDGGGVIFWTADRVQTGRRDIVAIDGVANIGDVIIARGGTISGRVVRPDGSPRADVHITIGEPITQHAAFRGRTDADGRFRAGLIGAGPHTIFVVSNDPIRGPAARANFHFGPYHAGTSGVDLVVPDGIWVRVDIVDGEPGTRSGLVNGRVAALRVDRPMFSAATGSFNGPAPSEFHLQLQTPGRYSLKIDFDGSTKRVETEIVVTDDSDQRFTVTLR